MEEAAFRVLQATLTGMHQTDLEVATTGTPLTAKEVDLAIRKVVNVNAIVSSTQDLLHYSGSDGRQTAVLITATLPVGSVDQEAAFQHFTIQVNCDDVILSNSVLETVRQALSQ